LETGVRGEALGPKAPAASAFPMPLKLAALGAIVNPQPRYWPAWR